MSAAPTPGHPDDCSCGECAYRAVYRTGELALNMQGAWSSSRARDAVRTLQHASTAPALFRPETIAAAQADYAHASAEVARWSR